MVKKLRILAASDTHGESRLTKKLAEKAEKEKVDLVILCGDITGYCETKDIIKPFIEKKKKVLIIPGNHDYFTTTDILAEEYGVKNIHGKSAVYEDVGFFASGGADVGVGSITEKEMMENLKKAHSTLGNVRKKVMLTHMHPMDSLSEFSGIEGSKSIKKAIDLFQPDFVLHGHIHEAEGLEEQVGKTTIINVGKEGKILEL